MSPLVGLKAIQMLTNTVNNFEERKKNYKMKQDAGLYNLFLNRLKKE